MQGMQTSADKPELDPGAQARQLVASAAALTEPAAHGTHFPPAL